ncbi:RNA-binding S4 domain-containing protein [Parvibaculum sp.]|jgi:ribosome-associated heat shock protein Hsp15|uniref:RNA-binding S4 domain-containing protein n=1 Tax=Parvibaculum sp. TaxID=2024848 RepID=UPI003477DF06
MSGEEGQSGQRIDRWLWFARFMKSRSLASGFVQTGRLRVNGERISKSSRLVRPGDILTFPLGPHIRVVKILGTGTRRGPAPEARLLYEDLSPPAAASETSDRNADAPLPVTRPAGAGRPTKKDRRDIAAWKDGA